MSAVAARCPHCKGSSFTLYERLEVHHSFRVEEGIAEPMQIGEGIPCQTGFAATCDCGYMWTPRRTTAMQIMDAEAEARGVAR